LPAASGSSTLQDVMQMAGGMFFPSCAKRSRKFSERCGTSREFEQCAQIQYCPKRELPGRRPLPQVFPSLQRQFAVAPAVAAIRRRRTFNQMIAEGLAFTEGPGRGSSDIEAAIELASKSKATTSPQTVRRCAHERRLSEAVRTKWQPAERELCFLFIEKAMPRAKQA